MTETLEVNKRESTGKLRNRRLRLSGKLPAVLYGHGMEPVNLALCEDQFQTLLRHGARVVELSGAESGQALVQEVQWDTFQHQVLHVDLLRLEQGERVTVEIPLVLRGEAPGERNGGVVEQLVREIRVELSPADIPEVLHVNVNHLELGSSLPLSAIEDLPAGATIVGDASQPAVQCVLPSAEAEVEPSEAAGPAEPELIGRRAAEEEASEE